MYIHICSAECKYLNLLTLNVYLSAERFGILFEMMAC